MKGDDLRERTKKYALRIIHLFRKLPKAAEAQVIGRQLLRSGTSVGAHFREGYRARSKAEFISKMTGGLQELDESSYWIELLIEADIVSEPKLLPLLNETNELIAIFTSIVKSQKSSS
jgi:four helix bundle protein